MVYIPTDDFDPDKPWGQGQPPPGLYHCQGVSAEDVEESYRTDDKTGEERRIAPHTKLRWEVVSPSEREKQFTDTVWHESSDGDPKKNANAARKMLAIALACGVVSRDEIEAAKAAGQGIEIDWVERFPGCQAVVRLEKQKGKSDYIQVAYGGYYALGDKGAEKCEYDAEIASLVGFTPQAHGSGKAGANNTHPRGGAGGGAAGRSQPQPQTRTQQPAAAPAAGPMFDDI